MKAIATRRLIPVVGAIMLLVTSCPSPLPELNNPFDPESAASPLGSIPQNPDVSIFQDDQSGVVTVNARWDAIPDAERYHLQIAEEESFAEVSIRFQDDQITGTSVEWTGAADAVQYWVRLRYVAVVDYRDELTEAASPWITIGSIGPVSAPPTDGDQELALDEPFDGQFDARGEVDSFVLPTVAGTSYTLEVEDEWSGLLNGADPIITIRDAAADGELIAEPDRGVDRVAQPVRFTATGDTTWIALESDNPDTTFYRLTVREESVIEEGTPVSDLAFADGAVRDAVVAAVGIDGFAENVRDLILPATTTDLGGINQLTNLESLSVDFSSGVSDLAPLSGMESLTGLSIMYSDVTSIEPLSTLANLELLHLDGNAISDLTPLASLGFLRDVMVTQTAVTDLSPLFVNGNALEILWANGLELDSIVGVSSLSNLREIYLSFSTISDGIDELASLPLLNAIDLDGAQGVDATETDAVSAQRGGDEGFQMILPDGTRVGRYTMNVVNSQDRYGSSTEGWLDVTYDVPEWSGDPAIFVRLDPDPLDFGEVSLAAPSGELTFPVLYDGGYILRARVGGLPEYPVGTFVVGSASTVEGAPDTVPPVDVSGLTAESGAEEVVLRWTDPPDADLSQIEITWDSSSGSGSQVVAPGQESAAITSLVANTSYTFTVVTIDLLGNRSSGVTIEAVPRNVAGDLLWQSNAFAGQGTVWSSPAVTGGGPVYVAGQDGRVVGLGAATGATDFAAETGGSFQSGLAISAAGIVFGGSRLGSMYAIDPSAPEPANQIVWQFPTVGGVLSSPALSPDETVVYITTGANNPAGILYAFSVLDGTVLWEFDTGSFSNSSPAVASDGTVYFGADNGTLYAIDPSDGTEVWSTNVSGSIQSSPAIGADGTIYVGSFDQSVYAISPVDGVSQWSFTTGGAVESSPVVASDGTVYIGSADGFLYAINPDGTERAVALVSSGGSVRSAPAIGDDGTVFAIGFDGQLRAFDPDLNELWSAFIGGTGESSPTIGPDGTLYVGGNETVTAVYTGLNGPAVTSWPQFGAGSGNTRIQQ